MESLIVSINENIKVNIYSNTKSWHYCLFKSKLTRLLFPFFLTIRRTEMYTNIKTFITFFLLQNISAYHTENFWEKFIRVSSSMELMVINLQMRWFVCWKGRIFLDKNFWIARINHDYHIISIKILPFHYMLEMHSLAFILICQCKRDVSVDYS